MQSTLSVLRKSPMSKCIDNLDEFVIFSFNLIFCLLFRRKKEKVEKID